MVMLGAASPFFTSNFRKLKPVSVQLLNGKERLSVSMNMKALHAGRHFAERTGEKEPVPFFFNHTCDRYRPDRSHSHNPILSHTAAVLQAHSQ
jgi:hypothetical protein